MYSEVCISCTIYWGSRYPTHLSKFDTLKIFSQRRFLRGVKHKWYWYINSAWPPILFLLFILVYDLYLFWYWILKVYERDCILKVVDSLRREIPSMGQDFKVSIFAEDICIIAYFIFLNQCLDIESYYSVFVVYFLSSKSTFYKRKSIFL